jgi:predicted ATP-grasp superfamily ATP-dependent carboligase
MSKKVKLAEFFAGSRSVGNVADEMGFQVFSIDWEPYEKVDLVADVEFMNTEDEQILLKLIHNINDT